jgi:LysM repeat protein
MPLHVPRSMAFRNAISRSVTIWVFLAGGMTAFAESASASTSRTCDDVQSPYTVVRNDSWSRIASKAGIAMGELLQLNRAKTSTFLLIGDTVCVPRKSKLGVDSQALKLPPPAKVYSVKQSRQIIRDVWPDRLEEKALVIVQRESHTNAAAYSSCCVGLFQIKWESHKSWLADIGVDSAHDLLDAEVNAKAALQLYKRSGGWGPWGG